MGLDASESVGLSDIEQNFDRLLTRFNEGDMASALHALAHAFYFRVEPPAWAVQHVAGAYGKWASAEVRSLDEALGVQRPKGFRMDAAQRFATHGGAILIEVNKRLETEAYDDEIFADIGRRWSIGKTAAKEIYGHGMEYLRVNHPQTHSRILSSRKNCKNPAGLKK